MRSLNLPELLLLAARTQEALRDAMNAAFGAALVVVSMNRTDPDAPLDESVIPTFEKMFARLVDPVIDAIYPEDPSSDDNDIRRFLMGQVREQARESNHEFFMGRVEALIENSQTNVEKEKLRRKHAKLRQNADKN